MLVLGPLPVKGSLHGRVVVVEGEKGERDCSYITASLHPPYCIILEVRGGGGGGGVRGMTGREWRMGEKNALFNLICYLQGRYRGPRSGLCVPRRYK